MLKMINIQIKYDKSLDMVHFQTNGVFYGGDYVILYYDWKWSTTEACTQIRNLIVAGVSLTIFWGRSWNAPIRLGGVFSL